MFGKRKKKISVPHGQFKRRFTHKKKTFFGKTKLYDANNYAWIDANDLLLDYAMQQIIYQMPNSDLPHPSESVSDCYVENGFHERPDFRENVPISSFRKEQIASDAAYNAEREERAQAAREEVETDRKQSVAFSESQPARFGGFESPSKDSSDSGYSSSDSGYSSSDSGYSSSSSSCSGSFDSGSF